MFYDCFNKNGAKDFIEIRLSLPLSMAMEWRNNHDIALAREVLLLEPYRYKARTVERGKVRQRIADNLNSHAVLRFLVTKKSVREHLS